jgi:hypothetical protein
VAVVADLILREVSWVRRVSLTGELLLFLGEFRPASDNIDSSTASFRVRTGLSIRTRAGFGLVARCVRLGLTLRLCLLEFSVRGASRELAGLSFRSALDDASRDDERSRRLVRGAFADCETGSSSSAFLASLLNGETEERVLVRCDFARVFGPRSSIDSVGPAKSMDGISLIDESERHLRTSGLCFFGILLLVLLRLLDSISSRLGLFMARSLSLEDRPLGFRVGLRGMSSRRLLLLLPVSGLLEDRELFDGLFDDDLGLSLEGLQPAGGRLVASLGVLHGESRSSHHGLAPPSSVHRTKLSQNLSGCLPSSWVGTKLSIDHAALLAPVDEPMVAMVCLERAECIEPRFNTSSSTSSLLLLLPQLLRCGRLLLRWFEVFFTVGSVASHNHFFDVPMVNCPDRLLLDCLSCFGRKA